VTRQPLSAKRVATVEPAGPPPITITSQTERSGNDAMDAAGAGVGLQSERYIATP